MTHQQLPRSPPLPSPSSAPPIPRALARVTSSLWSVHLSVILVFELFAATSRPRLPFSHSGRCCFELLVALLLLSTSHHTLLRPPYPASPQPVLRLSVQSAAAIRCFSLCACVCVCVCVCTCALVVSVRLQPHFLFLCRLSPPSLSHLVRTGEWFRWTKWELFLRLTSSACLTPQERHHPHSTTLCSAVALSTHTHTRMDVVPLASHEASFLSLIDDCLRVRHAYDCASTPPISAHTHTHNDNPRRDEILTR